MPSWPFLTPNATSAEFKGVYTNPAQHKWHESGRIDYNEDTCISDDFGASPPMSSDGSAIESAGAAAGGSASKSKTKLTDGTKIKVKSDGQVRLKDADGAKIK